MRYRVRTGTSPPPTHPGNSRKTTALFSASRLAAPAAFAPGKSLTLGRKALELAAPAVLSGLGLTVSPEIQRPRPEGRCAMNLADEIAALARQTVPELRQRYAALFGEATFARHKTWLVKRIAWRLQAVAEGELSERARQRALQLANDADLRLSPPMPAATCTDQTVAAPATTAEPAATADGVSVPPQLSPGYADVRLPAPGAILTRLYKGRRLEVTVLARGFAHDGIVYRSLSAVAKAITGSHCNAFLFFRLAGKEAP